MRTKTLAIAAAFGFGMQFVASANVVYDSETTNAWFGVNMSTLKTSDLSKTPWAPPTKGGEAAVVVKESANVIRLDTDLDDPLTYAASGSADVAVVAAEMTATVNATEPQIAAAPQAALAVIGNATATNWVGLVGNGHGTEWVTFPSPVPVAGRSYSVRIEFDQRTTKRIRYLVDGVVLSGEGSSDGWYPNPQTSAAKISNVSFSGSGDIKALAGENIIENTIAFNAPTEAEGYDFTNGAINVSAAIQGYTGVTAELKLVNFATGAESTVGTAQSLAGGASWDLSALTAGGTYGYTIVAKDAGGNVIATKTGTFTAAKWPTDWSGVWFGADATSGAEVKKGGDWDSTKEVPTVEGNAYVIDDDAIFNVTDQEPGANHVTRVDTKATFETLVDAASLEPETDALGGFVAAKSGDIPQWMALTSGNAQQPWVALTGALAPEVNVQYVIRAEIDFLSSGKRVRYLVSQDGGVNFHPLASGTAQWIPLADATKETLAKVELKGSGRVAKFEATVADKAVAEVGGVEFGTMTEALAAAKDDPNKSVRLLTNVTLAPTVAGTYKIVRNGHAFTLELPADWTSEWDESTGTLTVIDRRMPLLEAISASGITYGQTLAESMITGSMTNNTGVAVDGTFAWVDGTITPNVADGATNRLFEVAFTPKDQTKYFCATVETAVAVARAGLAVKADDKTVVAGNPAPEYTCTITGFVNTETRDDAVRGAASFACAYTTSSPTGTYDIVVSDGTLAADNYTFAFTKGTLTVQQAEAKYGDKYYASVEDALEAAQAAGEVSPKVTVLVVDPEKPAEIPGGTEVDYELNDEEVAAGSGTAVLPYTGSGTVKVTTKDASKNVIVVPPSDPQMHFTVTVETKPELVTAITLAGKALPSPSANDDFKAWLDANINAYKAANTSSDAILKELHDIVPANNISKLNNYLLFSKDVKDVTASDVVQVVKPEADTSPTGIKVDIPAVNPKSGMGYKVVYRVMRVETEEFVDEFSEKIQVEVPLTSGTGTYRVDAVIVPDNN